VNLKLLIALSVCAFILMVLNLQNAFGYQQPTHAAISAQAADNSVLSTPSTLSNLGLRALKMDDETQQFPNDLISDEFVQTGSHSILDLIRDGAQFEDSDSGHRSLNHFFDPISGASLTISCGPNFVVPTHTTSPNWALANRGSVSGQKYSYSDARQYFYDALTLPSESDRNSSWGKLFQTLGQVMHHIQDMAQPQHVRNDAHLDKYKLLGLNPCYNPSLYESYSNIVRATLPYSAPADAPFPLSVNIAAFSTPRAFWISSGKGIAEFSNSNFVSAGTNFDSGRYALPTTALPLEIDDIQTLCATANPACQNPNLSGSLVFVGSNVQDAYLGGAPVFNPRVSTFSIFDADLKTAGKQEVFTLNRFNFDEAHRFLIPRAVAYSAGLINYFFRGNFEISLPDEGVYSILDHGTVAGNDPSTGGFKKIKLKLKNATPGGTDAQGAAFDNDIAEGTVATLIAVVKFHRNTCYQADLSGEYGSPGKDWQSCRSPNEEIVVSAPAAVPFGVNTSPQEVTFDFSANVIPISATDLYLQVVYRGRLGQEQDAVIVATRDISEPSYTEYYSPYDQYTYCGLWPAMSNSGVFCTTRMTYADWCTTGGFTLAACNAAMGLTQKVKVSPTSKPVDGYDPAANPTVPPDTFADLSKEPPFPQPLVIATAPVGTLARFAVLIDAAPTNVATVVAESVDTTHSTAQFKWNTGTLTPTLNQFDPVTNTLSPTHHYVPFRGVFLLEADVTTTPAELGTASPMPSLTIVPSCIFSDFWTSC